MRRRDFVILAGSVVIDSSLAVGAQQPGQMQRIGFLRAAPPPEREFDAFLRGLADDGYVQGRNFTLIPQWGDGNVTRLAELAVALINAQADVIVAEARAAVADLVGAVPEGVVFGPSATALAYRMADALSRAWTPGDRGSIRRWLSRSVVGGGRSGACQFVKRGSTDNRPKGLSQQ